MSEWKMLDFAVSFLRRITFFAERSSISWKNYSN
jgi:hypothetical protein